MAGQLQNLQNWLVLINLLVTECTDDFNIRATVKFNDAQANLDYSDFLKSGNFRIFGNFC
jgi:hypothetical protein